jgi:hypothetical protein
VITKGQVWLARSALISDEGVFSAPEPLFRKTENAKIIKSFGKSRPGVPAKGDQNADAAEAAVSFFYKNASKGNQAQHDVLRKLKSSFISGG